MRLLSSLSPKDWQAPSAAPGWTVKDLALHLLDDDLGRLSRGRDDDRSGLLARCDHDTFVVALAGKNQRWVDGARGLSGRVITELLQWSGQQMDDHYASITCKALRSCANPCSTCEASSSDPRAVVAAAVAAGNAPVQLDEPVDASMPSFDRSVVKLPR